MAPTSAFPALLLLLMAIFSSMALVVLFGPPKEQGRFLAIDGLRGYLAFFVFLHHAMIWFFYLKTNKWEVPPSNLYTHFGQAGVAFFFMITGFLFFSKILDGKKRKIDWIRLYVSRFLRLAPLYIFAMGVLFSIVFLLSGCKLHQPFLKVFLELVRWMGFTVLGAPDINGVEKTSLIMAGVTWSLPYEWEFYFLLPVVALVNRTRDDFARGILLLVAVLLILFKKYNWLSFFGGFLAAYCVRSDFLCKFSKRKLASFLIIGLVFSTVFFYPTTYGAPQILMLSVAFVMIACGNEMFGFFTSAFSRTLGEISYSIYLLHGFLLFVTFRFIFGMDSAKNFTPVEHWGVAAGIVPLLIFLAYFCYKKIEHPALLKTNDWTKFVRDNFLSRKS